MVNNNGTVKHKGFSELIGNKKTNGRNKNDNIIESPIIINLLIS